MPDLKLPLVKLLKLREYLQYPYTLYKLRREQHTHTLDRYFGGWFILIGPDNLTGPMALDQNHYRQPTL